jgi:threonine aldolase
LPGRIDLRSDTVTRPSAAMRRAMAEAECGDAEYDDDPSVRELQERAAELTDMEAALYLVTGTMCNQVALHIHTRPGDQIVCAAGAHISSTEASTSALLNGLSFRAVQTVQGVMRADDVRQALAPDPDRGRIVPLVSIENTFADGGGLPWPLEDLNSVSEVARGTGLAIHLDGSRIFNATAATGVAVAEYTANVDTVMFCLSKGLGAPIGSVLCGPSDLIEAARATKILFGISWRQAGITAAAGLVALEESPPLLPMDHERARRLAERIAEMTPKAINLDTVATNFIFVDPHALGMDAAELAARLGAAGLLANVVDDRVRFVTHRDVSDADIDRASVLWREVTGD